MSSQRTVACLQPEGHAAPRAAGRNTGSSKGCSHAEIRGGKGTLLLLLLLLMMMIKAALYQRLTTFVFAFSAVYTRDSNRRMLAH